MASSKSRWQAWKKGCIQQSCAAVESVRSWKELDCGFMPRCARGCRKASCKVAFARCKIKADASAVLVRLRNSFRWLSSLSMSTLLIEWFHVSSVDRSDNSLRLLRLPAATRDCRSLPPFLLHKLQRSNPAMKGPLEVSKEISTESTQPFFL